MKDIHLKVPDRLHSEFKKACSKEERTMSDVLQSFMRDFVERINAEEEANKEK